MREHSRFGGLWLCTGRGFGAVAGLLVMLVMLLTPACESYLVVQADLA